MKNFIESIQGILKDLNIESALPEDKRVILLVVGLVVMVLFFFNPLGNEPDRELETVVEKENYTISKNDAGEVKIGIDEELTEEEWAQLEQDLNDSLSVGMDNENVSIKSSGVLVRPPTPAADDSMTEAELEEAIRQYEQEQEYFEDAPPWYSE